MLRAQGPQEWFFKELQAIAESTFRFQEASEAYDLVERLSMEMQFYEEKHILSGDDLFFEYDPEKIRKLLGSIGTWCSLADAVFIEQFTAENMLLWSTSHKYESICTSEEPWFEAKYIVEVLTFGVS